MCVTKDLQLLPYLSLQFPTTNMHDLLGACKLRGSWRISSHTQCSWSAFQAQWNRLAQPIMKMNDDGLHL